MQEIGDRMKGNYEDRARTYLTRRVPVIIRVDGKAFHTYTRDCRKPFDHILSAAMDLTAKAMVENIQGAKLAYVQSDEISVLLTDYDTLTTAAWFDYNVQKLVSIAAATATATFNRYMVSRNWPVHPANNKVALFDARAFNIPAEEVANYFLWRAKDWHRNSVNMLGRSRFSHKEMEGKSLPELHEMLHKIGINWTELAPRYRNGAYITPDGVQHNEVLPTYAAIDKLVTEVLPPNV